MENRNNDEQKDLRDAQTQGFGSDTGERAYIATPQNTDKDREDDDDDDVNEDEDESSDWGNVDPLDAPGSLPDPMDPSGPGSAV